MIIRNSGFFICRKAFDTTGAPVFLDTRNDAYTIEDFGNASSTVNRVSKLFVEEKYLEKNYVDRTLI